MTQSNLARATTPARVEPPAVPPPPRAPKAAPAAPVATSPSRGWKASTVLLVVLTMPLVAINIAGAPYYFASLAERARHPWHEWLKPSGYIGQSAGIAALLIFVFLWLYPARKKWRALKWTGSVGKWLDVHVSSALLLPLLLAIHASWRSDGVIGLGLVAMFVVIASGVVGRYLYTRIPRARSGVELTREEVASQRRELIERLATATGLAPAVVERTLDVTTESKDDPSLLGALGSLFTNDLLRWRRTRQLRERWAQMVPGSRPLTGRALNEAVQLAGREMSLTQQSRMLGATQRLFRFWHVAHRPFALTALVAVLIHVVVVVAVGATWFRS